MAKAILLLGLIVACAGASATARAAEVDYLSDVADQFILAHQGWGEMGLDRCAHALGQEPLPLRIGDKTFARGIGTHAPGEIRMDLNGEYDRFDVTIGLQPLPGGAASAAFAV